MVFLQSIITALAFWSTFFSVCMFGGLMVFPQDRRSQDVVDAVKQGCKKPNLIYWANLGYLKFINNYFRIFLITIGIMVSSNFVLYHLMH